MGVIKKLVIWACIAGVAYFFLSNHLVFVGANPKLLKKARLSMDHTFFSTQGKSNEAILKVEALRNAGVGQLLVQLGRISEEELERLTEKIEEAEGGSRK